MKEKEHQSIEWKESWQDEYLKWICGYANAYGGTIYIGTDDDGNVVGIDNARDLLERIPNKITDTMGIIADPENQHLRNGDTLDADWPTDEETEFDVVTMNPPYSAKWSAAEGFKQDERFMDYGGKLAPKSKADYAFLLHGFYHLKQTGTMAIVLPHGVLFRGAAEGTIRETLLQNGSIYAVIGLPANMFYNTSIPTCIVVLKKHRKGRDVLFIDASNLYEKEKKQNVMNEEHIDKVLELYNNRKTVDKLAYLASYDDIKANDYNLNIPRYVDTSEEEDEIDIKSLIEDIKETNKAINENNANLVDMLGNLTFSSSETETAVKELIDMLKEV